MSEPLEQIAERLVQELVNTPCSVGVEGCRDCQADAQKAIFSALLSVKAETLREAAAEIPSNWTDPLLTGANGIGAVPWYCPDIELLLHGIKQRLLEHASSQDTLQKAK